MKASLVFLLVVGVVTADIGLGYHYKAPTVSYGVPTYSFGNIGRYSSAYSGGLGSSLGSSFGSSLGSSLGSAQSLSGFGNSGYQGSEFLSTGFQNAETLSPSGFYQSTVASNIVQPTVLPTALPTVLSTAVPTALPSALPTILPSAQPTVLSSAAPLYYTGSSGLGNGFQSLGSSSQFQGAEQYQTQYQVQQQPTQVFKHFYVHAAPEEPELPKARAPIVLPPAQKHYKIIFVKTPTESHRSQAVVPVQPQNEEKTIVYVLVKKPEDQHEVIVPKIEQKPPSKPEVYFIKYRNKEDSQAVINNIVQDLSKGGQQVSVLNSGVGDSSFNSAAGLSQSAFNTGSVLSDASYSGASGFGSSVQYTPAIQSGSSGIGSSVQFTPAVQSGSSGFGSSVQYAPAVQSDVSSSAFAVTQSPVSSFNVASGPLTSATTLADVNEETYSSTASPIVTVSTTASSAEYDGASAISTSQGIPHETYGPPKFRV